jgi:hypothetical protein
VDGLEDVFIIMDVEKRQLLAAMSRVRGISASTTPRGPIRPLNTKLRSKHTGLAKTRNERHET